MITEGILVCCFSQLLCFSVFCQFWTFLPTITNKKLIWKLWFWLAKFLCVMMMTMNKMVLSDLDFSHSFLKQEHLHWAEFEVTNLGSIFNETVAKVWLSIYFPCRSYASVMVFRVMLELEEYRSEHCSVFFLVNTVHPTFCNVVTT